jgi:hypothetical protein
MEYCTVHNSTDDATFAVQKNQGILHSIYLYFIYGSCRKVATFFFSFEIVKLNVRIVRFWKYFLTLLCSIIIYNIYCSVFDLAMIEGGWLDLEGQ